MDQKLLNDKYKIRAVWNEEVAKWYFVIADIAKAITYTFKAKDYVKGMRKRSNKLAEDWDKITKALLVETPGGRQKLFCADIKGIIQIINEFPSPKAKPYKIWIACFGSNIYRRIDHAHAGVQKTSTYEDKSKSDIPNKIADKNKKLLEKLKKAMHYAKVSKNTLQLSLLEYVEIKDPLTQAIQGELGDVVFILSLFNNAHSFAEIFISDANTADINWLPTKSKTRELQERRRNKQENQMIFSSKAWKDTQNDVNRD